MPSQEEENEEEPNEEEPMEEEEEIPDFNGAGSGGEPAISQNGLPESPASRFLP